MDALTVPTATSAAATPPTPAPVAVPTVPQPMANGSMVSGGGGTSLTAMLKELNWVEVGFGILGATALYYTIYYYKYKFDFEKNLKNQMQTDIDDLSDRVEDLENLQTEQPKQSFDGFGTQYRAVPTGYNAIW